jgi:hypothetical protein
VPRVAQDLQFVAMKSITTVCQQMGNRHNRSKADQRNSVMVRATIDPFNVLFSRHSCF